MLAKESFSHGQISKVLNILPEHRISFRQREGMSSPFRLSTLLLRQKHL